MSVEFDGLIAELRALADPAGVETTERFRIESSNVLGVRTPELRRIARRFRRQHTLALELWESGLYEARVLATLIDDPKHVTEEQMEAWAAEFDSWGVVDAACGMLFDRTPFAWDKALEWSGREEEYVKRAGFVLMASLAVHDKKASDDGFIAFLPVIERESWDERNFVKKAVNWALRQIGKRNLALNAEAIRCGERVRETGTRAGRWTASDALRELRSDAVRGRLRGRE
jgi:3-methyladenine DNA glycosylase AlkD